MRQFIDQRFGDRYTLREQVGVGGMALVFRAWDDKLETDVALKVLKPELTDSGEVDVEGILKKFEQEIRVVVTVNHPHIVQILDRGQHEGLFYYVMRFVPGGSLAARIRERRGPLGIDETLQVLRQVGGALQRAHEAGVYHRDIKPSNILVEQSRGGDVDYFLADFGIAKAVEDTSLPAVTLSGSGTPGYMSPEQAFGDPFDHRTDVFSLGVATYEMVTGKRPFTGDSLTALMRAVTTQDPVPPSQHNPKVTPLLEAAILKAMKRSPEQRFGSVREFVAACEAGAAATESGRTVVMPARGRSGRQAPRRVAGWFALTAILIAVAGAAWWVSNREAVKADPGAAPTPTEPRSDGEPRVEPEPRSDGKPQVEPEQRPSHPAAANDGRADGSADPGTTTTPTAPPVASGLLLCSSSAGDYATLAELAGKAVDGIADRLREQGVARIERLDLPFGAVPGSLDESARERDCAWVLRLHAVAKLKQFDLTLEVDVELAANPADRPNKWRLGPAGTGDVIVRTEDRKGTSEKLLALLLWGERSDDLPGLPAGAKTFADLLPELASKINQQPR